MKQSIRVCASLLAVSTCAADASVFELEHQSLGAATTMTGGPFELGISEAVAIAGVAYGGPFSIEATTSTLIRDTDFHLVNVSAEGNGLVNPTGIVEVDSGGTIDISIQSSTYHHISELTLRDVEVPINALKDYTLTLENLATDTTVSVVFGADTTTHGVPHWWLAQYHGDGDMEVLAISDHDGDGMIALGEWESGTLPNDASSVFSIQSFKLNNNEVEISWSSVPGKRYGIYYSADLNSGEVVPIERSVVADSYTTTAILPKSNASKLFYFIQIEQ